MTALRRLLNPGFVQDVLVMSGGTVGAQALLILSSPLLTRLYTPDEFGAFAVFSAFLGVLVVVASLRYEFAIPLPEREEDARGLLLLSLGLVVVISLLILLLLLAAAPRLAELTQVPELRRYSPLVALGILGVGSYQVFNYYSTRKQQFRLLSATKLWQSVCQVGLQLAGGFMGLGVLGLFGGYVLGRAAGSGALARQVDIRPLPNTRALRSLAGRYADFPKYYAPAALINSLGMELPALIFAPIFGLSVAGFFSLTVRMLTLPVFLLGQATGQVFYPQAASLANEPEKTRLFVEKVATGLLFVSFPLFGFVALVGPELFALVFGEEWAKAGLYARYLSPWFSLSLIVSPIITFVLVKEKQRQALFVNTAETAARLGVLWLGGRYLSADASVLLYGLVGVGVALYSLLWVLRLAGSSLVSWLRPVRLYLPLGALLLAGLAYLGMQLGPLLAAALQLSALAAFGFWSLRYFLGVYRA